MTTTHDLERELVRALDRIGDYWDALLPTTIPAVGGGGTRSRRSVAAEYDDPADGDLSLADRRISLRHDIAVALNGWARIIAHDADVEHGLPAAGDVPALLAFLRRWAQWFSGHERAAEAVDAIRAASYAVKSAAAPKGRDWLTIGPCPREVDGDDGQPHVCGRVVRAYIGETSVEQMLEDGQTFIRCPGCGHKASLKWWASQIVPEGANIAPADDVIAYVSVRTREPITEAQLRQWATRKRITRHGRDARGRMLYDCAEVLAYVQAPKTKTGKVIA